MDNEALPRRAIKAANQQAYLNFEANKAHIRELLHADLFLFVKRVGDCRFVYCDLTTESILFDRRIFQRPFKSD